MNELLIAGLVLSWCFIGAGCWLGWQLLKQNGRMLLRLDDLQKRLDELEFGEETEPPGLPLDSLAPEFDLPDLEGRRHTLAKYRGQQSLLVFFNPACGFCRDLMTSFAAGSLPLEEKDGDRTPIAPKPLILLISSGEPERNRQFFAEYKLTCPILLQKEMEIAAAYKANGTPMGYLISADGKIASPLAVGAEPLLALAEGGPQPQALSHPILEGGQQSVEKDRATRFSSRSLARSKIKRDGLKAGTPAPNFRLPRLNGRGELSLEELRGKRVLLVFSDPNCVPCNALAPQLENFHREHSEMAIVMISRGAPQENRAKVKEHGLTFPILLQHQWEISRLYAMFATPMAYLTDETGVIARDVAVGLEPIQALMVELKK